jgi:hypothetical protein
MKNLAPPALFLLDHYLTLSRKDTMTHNMFSHEHPTADAARILELEEHLLLLDNHIKSLKAELRLFKQTVAHAPENARLYEERTKYSHRQIRRPVVQRGRWAGRRAVPAACDRAYSLALCTRPRSPSAAPFLDNGSVGAFLTQAIRSSRQALPVAGLFPMGLLARCLPEAGRVRTARGRFRV